MYLKTLTIRLFFCSGEEFCNTDGFTFDTKAEDLRHVWIPMTLKMSISKSQGLEIKNWTNGEELSSEEEAEGAALYDLVVTVPHVLDTRTGGNLVAHIKVGETYHQRKEVSDSDMQIPSMLRHKVVFCPEALVLSLILTFVLTCVFILGGHAPAVVPLQRLLNRAH